jgi:hypothetical protein
MVTFSLVASTAVEALASGVFAVTVATSPYAAVHAAPF